MNKDFTQRNKKIKQTLAQTRSKRKNQLCKVYDLKIQQNKLSKRQKEDLKMLFVESKWLYNDVLNYCKEDILNKPSNYKLIKTVKVKTKEGNFEERELKHLAVQSQQSLIAGMISSIKTLSTLKKQGYKVGSLKFKSDFNVVNLKQFNVSYKIFKNSVKVQGVHKHLKVRGLNQISNDAEFANAKLIKSADGYHLKVACFFNKEQEVNINKAEVGVDFGCTTSFTLSTGEKINCVVEESERLKRLKRLQRKLEFLKKGSNNRHKLILKIQKEYLKNTYKKNDAANKLVHNLLSHYSLIAVQDEQIKEWHEDSHGKAVQHSILGRVKAKLKQSNKVYIVSKWEPTTKTCFSCGNKYDIKLNERTYKCSYCGYIEDRDINAAKNILKAVPKEFREVSACNTQEDHQSSDCG